VIFLGLDPGASGGIGWIAQTAGVMPMPATERDVYEALRDLARYDGGAVAVVEAVHEMPGQHGQGKFLTHYGTLRGFLIALGIPFVEVSPMKWQKAIGCLTPPGKPRTMMTQAERSKAKREHKRDLLALAQQFYPGLTLTLATSDAILLARYCAAQDWRGTLTTKE